MALQSIDQGFDIAIESGGSLRLTRNYEGMGLLERLFCDRIGQLRRPVLLLTVVCLDLILTALAGASAFALTATSPFTSSIALATILTLPWLVISVLGANWSYSVSSLRRPAAQIGKISTAIGMVALASNGLQHLSASQAIAPVVTLIWSAAALVVLSAARIATAQLINYFAKSGRLRRRAVIVGGGKDADRLIELLSDDATHLEILGVFDDRAQSRDHAQSRDRASHTPGAPPPGGHTPDSPSRLGTFDELESFCRDTGVELLIVSMPAATEDRLLEIVKQLLTLPVDIRISAHTSKLRLNRQAYTYIGKVPMLPILDRPLSDADRMVKNIEDRIIGLAALIVAAPVMMLVALAVRLESKGPILFRQKRLGFNNELIEVYKFRSMYADMSDAAAARLVIKDDPRVTRVGRFIRKTSLDELPQLFNVMRGEMSMVGPRPHALQAKAGDELYHDAVRSYFARHKVKPGITGWAQVNGWRGETDTLEKIEQRVEHDMHYINNWSVLFDLYIVTLTPFSLIGGKNAY